jgi:divalent metal cation (Fe/Co/Zn/Cd) transporter
MNLIGKVVAKAKKCKALVVAACTAVSVCAVGLVACAEGESTAQSAVTSAMSTVASDMISTGTAILPIALGVVGLGLVVSFGIKMFKRIANKG